MSDDAGRGAPAMRTPLTWLAVVALAALPVVWLDVFLLSPQEETADYVIGRWSLLLAAAGFVALVVERVRGALPWAALACAALAWVGVVLGRALGAGESAYPWLVAVAAVVAAAAAGMPASHRRACLRVALVLGVVGLVGLVGLA